MDDEIRTKMRRTIEAIGIKGKKMEKRHQVMKNKLRGSKALIRNEIILVEYKVGVEIKTY